MTLHTPLVQCPGGLHKFQPGSMIYVNATIPHLWYTYTMTGRHILYILLTSGAVIALASLLGGS